MSWANGFPSKLALKQMSMKLTRLELEKNWS